MPYPNEHSCRMRDSGDFGAETFRRISRENEEFPDGSGKKYPISLILGKPKGATSPDDPMVLQAFRYPKDDWDAETAAAHCKHNKGTTFEAASKEKDESETAEETDVKEASDEEIRTFYESKDMPVPGEVAEVLVRANAVLAELERIMAETREENAQEPVAPEAGEPQELETVKLAETASGASVLSEGAPDNGQGPLMLKAQLIEPGFGNSKDNHYYPKEMLARDARMFIGAKMYESDHGPKTNENWVSTITDVLGFSDTGAPIVEVLAHKPDFIQRVKNLNKGGLLDKLECSILADGKVKKNQKVDGRLANIVEGIVKAGDVDWVTKAGAGGQAIALMEKAEVTKALKATTLPEASQNELAKREYENVEKLQEAVAEHIEYLKAVTGSGKPFGQDGGGHANEPMSEEDYEKRYEKIMERHNVHRYGGT